MRDIYQKFLLVCFCSFVLSGCSVFMAMHGKPDANLSCLTVGQDRGIVVMNLGEPVATYVKDGVRVDTHEVQNGNAPSPIRAIGHGLLDILTFGFWEVIGTPVEGLQGKTNTVTVEYDENDKLVSVNTVSGHVQKAKVDKKKSETAVVSEKENTAGKTPETVSVSDQEKPSVATNFEPAGETVK